MNQISNNPAKYTKENQSLKVAVVRSDYYQDLTDSMEKACRKYLVSSGVKKENITTFAVPGSWEIPLVTKKIAVAKKFDGVIALGVIIKGETYHFEVLANECTRALMNISLKFNIPITFAVLATLNRKQAEKRSAGRYNRGKEAARSLLETLKIISKL